ncbi:MAG: hypothetical protein ACLP1X_00690 [Polyangiaceae bacterium]
MIRQAALLAVVAVAVPLFAAACGGAEPEPAQPANPPASASAAAPAEAPASASAPPAASAPPVASASAASGPPAAPKDGEWDMWSHDQKMAYMKAAVMPKMGGLFHDFDGKRYAETKCSLCHGSGAKDGSFKMPNPELPKLDVTPAGMKAMHEKKAAVVEFMAKQVVPNMAQLLGEPPFDMQTHKGFGCMGCHTMKK